ncbi:MAG: hypothetical protein EHM20_07675, partial [Alphaproteobacteria bacterium]
MLKNFLFIYIAFVSFVSSQLSSKCLAGTPTELNETKQNIISLIDGGKFAESESAINKLITDFNDNTNLQDTLFLFTEKYEGKEKFNEAKRVYQQISQKYPNNSYARLGISREDIMTLIASKNYDDALIAVNKMKSDFTGNPDLSNTLYWIAARFEWSKQFDDAKAVYKLASEGNPDSTWALKAKLGVSKAEIMYLVESGNLKLSKDKLNKMVSEFEKHTDMAETLFWIAEEYKWARRFEDAKEIYQQLILKYPQTYWAAKAKLCKAGADVMSFIVAQDFNTAKIYFDKLKSDFKESPDLPETLSWIAEKYKWSNKFDETESISKEIINKYPDSTWASKAKEVINREDIMYIVMVMNYDRPEETLDELFANYANHPDLQRAIIIAGDQFCKQGLKLNNEDTSDQAKEQFDKALRIWEGFIKRFPHSELIPEAYCWAGDCYSFIGKHEDAIRCFQRVVDVYQKYKFAWHAQLAIGTAYQDLKKAGIIS